MPVTFIGDVHGWSTRLEQVLAQSEDALVFMGDLIDRGPDAPAVLERVKDLCAAGRARCLLGNHEFALLNSIGAPTRGILAQDRWFRSWRDHYGGHQVLAAYGARDAAELRTAMGERLVNWLAQLPWCLSDTANGCPWIAVHAGMMPEVPLRDQLTDLADGWSRLGDWPFHLYDKQHVRDVPIDLPHGTVLVSGHVPLDDPLVTPQRILCDTTGGLPQRRLSGVVWPSGRVIRSEP
ncbi:MAG: metallophosphoesterase [Planctomycetota bacterium]